MAEPLPCDPDEILSYEPAGADGIRVVFRDGSERVFSGDDARRIAEVLERVTPPTA